MTDITVTIKVPCELDDTELAYRVASGSVIRPAFDTSGSCVLTHAISHVIITKDGYTVTPSFIDYDDTSLTFHTNDFSLLGVYEVQVIAVHPTDPSITGLFTLKVWTFCDDW